MEREFTYRLPFPPVFRTKGAVSSIFCLQEWNHIFNDMFVVIDISARKMVRQEGSLRGPRSLAFLVDPSEGVLATSAPADRGAAGPDSGYGNLGTSC